MSLFQYAVGKNVRITLILRYKQKKTEHLLQNTTHFRIFQGVEIFIFNISHDTVVAHY
jgi:hypothetical protein